MAANTKTHVRRVLREARIALSPSLVEDLSGQVQTRVLRVLEGLGRIAALVLYSPVQNEVATWLLFEAARKSGIPVYFPKIVPPGQVPLLAQVRGLEELKPDTYGIPAPVRGAPVAPATLRCSVVCVPGIAFSTRGERVGRGGGYYDRLCAQLPAGCVTIGLSYAFQVLPELPQEPWDLRLDWVVTESAIHDGSSVGRGGKFATRGGGTACNGY